MDDSIKPPESDGEGRLDDLFQSLIEQSVPYLSEILKASASVASGLAVVAPHVGNLILAYRQKRAERNLRKLIEELQRRMIAMEELLSKMEPALRQEIREKVFPALLDFVHDEPEEAKVPHYAAGFHGVLNSQLPTHPNVLFTQFSELLSQLTHVEFLVLADMAVPRGGGPINFDMIPGGAGYLEARGLTALSFDFIQKKLHRLDLLSDRNERATSKHLELLSNVVEQLLSKHPQFGSDARQVGFFRDQHDADYEVTRTAQRLLAFCELKSDLIQA